MEQEFAHFTSRNTEAVGDGAFRRFEAVVTVRNKRSHLFVVEPANGDQHAQTQFRLGSDAAGLEFVHQTEHALVDDVAHLVEVLPREGFVDVVGGNGMAKLLHLFHGFLLAESVLLFELQVLFR